jgi:hypothetical protein
LEPEIRRDGRQTRREKPLRNKPGMALDRTRECGRIEPRSEKRADLARKRRSITTESQPPRGMSDWETSRRSSDERSENLGKKGQTITLDKLRESG